MTEAKPSINIYTDGSRMGNRTGFGWFVAWDGHCVHEQSGRLSDHASVYQAELYAIAKATDHILQLIDDYMEKSITIWTDSRSAVAALQRPIHTDESVYKVAENIKTIRQFTDIDVVWVRGHADNTGNELADVLAKKGTNLAEWTPVPIPWSNIKFMIKDHFWKRWKHRWNNETACRQTKEVVPEPGKISIFDRDGAWSRLDLNLLCQFTTGHAVLGKHLGQWQEQSATCRLCNEGNETPLHFMLECPALWREQQDLLTVSPTSSYAKCIIRFAKCKKITDLIGSV